MYGTFKNFSMRDVFQDDNVLSGMLTTWPLSAITLKRTVGGKEWFS